MTDDNRDARDDRRAYFSLRAWRALRLTVAVIAAGSLAACGGSSSEPSAVAAPAAAIVTETFNGTVQVGQTNVHPFTVTTPGTLSVTLTQAGPPATITMGLGIGNPNAAGACVFLSGATTLATASTTTPQLSGTVGASGAYCVGIGDVGNAAGPIAYSITVSHT